MEMHITHLQKRITAMKSLLEESNVDNRVVEEELSQRMRNNMRFVEDHQHPLADVKDSVFDENMSSFESSLNSFVLRREMDSVSLNWRSLRNIKECICSTPFDHFSKKVSFPVPLFNFNLIIINFAFILIVGAYLQSCTSIVSRTSDLTSALTPLTKQHGVR